MPCRRSRPALMFAIDLPRRSRSARASGIHLNARHSRCLYTRTYIGCALLITVLQFFLLVSAGDDLPAKSDGNLYDQLSRTMISWRASVLRRRQLIFLLWSRSTAVTPGQPLAWGRSCGATRAHPKSKVCCLVTIGQI